MADARYKFELRLIRGRLRRREIKNPAAYRGDISHGTRLVFSNA
jgi:hypothetical protein